MLIFFQQPIPLLFILCDPPKKKNLTPNYHAEGFFRCNFTTTELDEGESPFHTALQISSTGQLLADSTFFPYGETVLQSEWKGGATSSYILYRLLCLSKNCSDLWFLTHTLTHTHTHTHIERKSDK